MYILVFPPLSLMTDQVAKLNSSGVAAAVQLDREDNDSVLDLLSKGILSHVFTASTCHLLESSTRVCLGILRLLQYND